MWPGSGIQFVNFAALNVRGGVDTLPAIFLFYANGIGTGTSLQFLFPYDANLNADGVERYFLAARDLTLTSLRVNAFAAGTGNGNTQYTVRKNGVDTALTLNVDNDTSPYGGLATVAPVSFLAGDRISLGKLSVATITTSPSGVVVRAYGT